MASFFFLNIDVFLLQYFLRAWFGPQKYWTIWTAFCHLMIPEMNGTKGQGSSSTEMPRVLEIGTNEQRENKLMCWW